MIDFMTAPLILKTFITFLSSTHLYYNASFLPIGIQSIAKYYFASKMQSTNKPNPKEKPPQS
jgi:hypothetical protein